MIIKQIPLSYIRSFSTIKQYIPQVHQSQTASLSDFLIRVSKNDDYVGKITKKDAHLVSCPYIHRAFSLFLFDNQNRLLLQQRAKSKITFPNYWTNTCCSHPLHIPSELYNRNFLGVKNAAKNRLKFEMGIQLDVRNPLLGVGKIYYKAAYDETWGENEVDYILFTRNNSQYGQKNNLFNKDEVQDVAWVEKNKLKEFLKEKEEKGEKTTPWFQAILNYKLFEWWDAFEKSELETDMKKVIDLST